MEKTHFVFLSFTETDLAVLKENLKTARKFYENIYDQYQTSLKTKDSIAIYSKSKALESAETNLEQIEMNIDYVQSELDMSNSIGNPSKDQSIFSNYTGEDLNNLETQIKEALVVYQKYVDEYNWGVQNGSSSYAKRIRKPRMDAAKSVLDTLNAQKKAMLSDIGQIQGIELVDTTTKEAVTKPTGETPWGTIGLAVGALVAVVVIVKVL